MTSLSGTIPTVIAVWPCDCGDVLVEPGKAKPGYRCRACGSLASTYVLLDAVMDRVARGVESALVTEVDA